MHLNRPLLLSALLTLPLVGSGCTGLTGLATQLKDDPAVVRLDIVTLYGTGKLIRVGSNTNAVSIAPDGTITINPDKQTGK